MKVRLPSVTGLRFLEVVATAGPGNLSLGAVPPSSGEESYRPAPLNDSVVQQIEAHAAAKMIAMRAESKTAHSRSVREMFFALGTIRRLCATARLLNSTLPDVEKLLHEHRIMRGLFERNALKRGDDGAWHLRDGTGASFRTLGSLDEVLATLLAEQTVAEKQAAEAALMSTPSARAVLAFDNEGLVTELAAGDESKALQCASCEQAKVRGAYDKETSDWICLDCNDQAMAGAENGARVWVFGCGACGGDHADVPLIVSEDGGGLLAAPERLVLFACPETRRATVLVRGRSPIGLPHNLREPIAPAVAQ